MQVLKNKDGVIMKKRFIRALCFFFVLMTAFQLTAAASTNDIPYDSYTYWYNYSGKGRTPVYSKPIYSVSSVIDASSLSLKNAFGKITDVTVGKDGCIYILDGGASQLVALNPDNTVKFIVKSVLKNGAQIDFTGALGICCDDKNIYVCNTEKGSVEILSLDGAYTDEIKCPDSKLVPDDFKYRPIKLEKDSKDNYYVLCDGSYYGALLFSGKREFLGFYGSNDVQQTVLQTVEKLWNKLFMTDEKRSGKATALPYQFIDLCSPDGIFIYTCTGKTEKNIKSGQIRKLNPAGDDVLNADSVDFTDSGDGSISLDGRTQDLVSVAADNNGFIYTVDSAFGHIFIYDKNANTVGVFGCGTGEGTQAGSFKLPCAISVYNDKLFVADSNQNAITVFTLTEYGKNLLKAQSITLSGKYEDAKPYWDEVIKNDQSCQLAYAGLARYYYSVKDYKKALDYAKTGFDRDTYSLAFEKLRNEFIRNNFTPIILIFIAVVAAIIAIAIIKKKKNIVLIKNKSVRFAVGTMLHPVDNFKDVKQKNMGSVPISTVFMLLFYISSVMKTTNGGFSYVYFDSSSFNAAFVFLQTVGLVLAWTVVNWAVCTLADGKGTLKQIYIVTNYSLLPLIISNFLYVIFTNVLVTSELDFLNVFMTVMLLYTVIMLLLGLIEIHDISFSRAIITVILSIIGILLIVFIIALLIILIQQTYGFLSTIVIELFNNIKGL